MRDSPRKFETFQLITFCMRAFKICDIVSLSTKLDDCTHQWASLNTTSPPHHQYTSSLCMGYTIHFRIWRLETCNARNAIVAVRGVIGCLPGSNPWAKSCSGRITLGISCNFHHGSRLGCAAQLWPAVCGLSLEHVCIFVDQGVHCSRPM